MVKVITYGTFDLLHYGHIRLLERAKKLGDYLIVGVTADDYDKTRGKINVQQSLVERVEAVRATGLADEIIIEEYEGQKIDDIRQFDVDIFTVGSDWVGYFDYLKEYCNVVYLDRTEGISSSEIRENKRLLRLGLVGNSAYLNKVAKESSFVNGMKIAGLCTRDVSRLSEEMQSLPVVTASYAELLKNVDAVYVHSTPGEHYEQIKQALQVKKHVLCESPIALSVNEAKDLFKTARNNKCILMAGLKTAYANAYLRMLLIAKSGKIGRIVSVSATCTSLSDYVRGQDVSQSWNSICDWGPTGLLPIFQLLGSEKFSNRIVTHYLDEKISFDDFTKIDITFPSATATVVVGKGMKAEGELVIGGTKGYIYVPAPWWKTDYFETRYENPAENKRFFYQLDGEGIRYELVAFLRAIENGTLKPIIADEVSLAICRVIENFMQKKNIVVLKD